MGTLFKSMYENAHCELLSDETLNLKTKETLIRVNKNSIQEQKGEFTRKPIM